MERCHVFAEMIGDECGDLFDAVVRGEEGAEADGSVEDLVELIYVGDVLQLGEGEKFPVEAALLAPSFRLGPWCGGSAASSRPQSTRRWEYLSR